MSSTNKARRAQHPERRIHLHALSWVVLFLMTAAVVMLTVPGSEGVSVEWTREQLSGSLVGPVPQYSDFHFTEVATWSHGWPFEYLRRPFDFDGSVVEINGCLAIWGTRRAWRLWGDIYAFSILNLLLDALIGVSLVAITVWACEFWHRRRTGFRFSLLDTAVIATTFCSLLGWWQFHARAVATEQQVKQNMIGRGSLSGHASPTRAWVQDNYCGPHWLARLAGCPGTVSFCVHIDELWLDTRLLTRRDYKDLELLRYVQSIHLAGELNKDLTTALSKLPALRKLDGDMMAFGGFTLATWPQPLVSRDSWALLSRLPMLRVLRFGHSKVTPKELLELAERPHLEEVELADTDLLVEDIEPLTQSGTLKKLDLYISATFDERKEFEKRHPYIEVNWRDNQLVDDAERYAEINECVCLALFKHWLQEDGVSQNDNPLSPDQSFLRVSGHASDKDDPWQVESLDFSQVRLTHERLQRIPLKTFPNATGVTLGQVDAAATAMQLIRQCGALRSLDARYAPLAIEDLRTVVLQPENSLYLMQGPVSVDEFCELVRKCKPQLTIYGSSFTANEAQRIYEAGCVSLEVYKHFTEEDADRTYPPQADDDGENPFK